MKLLHIFLFGAGIVGSVYSNVIPMVFLDKEEFCPTEENIAPCICFKDPISKSVTARCSNFTDPNKLQAIFSRNSDWNIADLSIAHSSLPFLPAKMIEETHFNTLMVRTTTLDTLFDTKPVSTQERNLYLENLKIARGFRWSDIAGLDSRFIITRNVTIGSLGRDFKDNCPRRVFILALLNSRVANIQNQAFSDLDILYSLSVTGGSLKKLSRNWFPRPCNIVDLNLSYHKIAALPDNIFEDFPHLYQFTFKGNLLTTISEKLFTLYNVKGNFEENPLNCDCNIEWILQDKKFTSYQLEGECFEPEFLIEKKLRELNHDYFKYCH